MKPGLYICLNKNEKARTKTIADAISDVPPEDVTHYHPDCNQEHEVLSVLDQNQDFCLKPNPTHREKVIVLHNVISGGQINPKFERVNGVDTHCLNVACALAKHYGCAVIISDSVGYNELMPFLKRDSTRI